MSEKLCALRKIGGGTNKVTFRLGGTSGNGSGSNVGGGNFTLENTHLFSTLKLTARGGSVGTTRIVIDGVVTNTPALNQDYDIKGKSVNLQIYVSGTSAYAGAYFDVELS